MTDDKAVPSASSGGTGPSHEEQEGEERIVVRDRRRIDPHGTEPRTGGTKSDKAEQPVAETAEKPAGRTTEKPAGSESEELAAARKELEERTSDLKRVVAEYANYRRRVERDRTVAAEQATGVLLISLLPVLDDLDRAREHGDLVGPFGTVAEQLVSILTKAGLTAYGEAGDPFDPMHHEAVAHSTSPDVTEPTCVLVMRRGYRLGERLLRPAMVGVADPEPAGDPADAPDAADVSAAEAESSTEGTDSN